MNLFAKNVAINIAYYAVTVVLLPAALLQLEERLGFRRSFDAPLPVTLFCAVSGVLLQGWCIAALHRIGRGTPSPAFPTTALVTEGPYRLVRNPLNIGELLLLFSVALWFGSLTLLGYTLLAWGAFHAFIVHYEEPLLTRRFGPSYQHYRSRVHRWLPSARSTPFADRSR